MYNVIEFEFSKIRDRCPLLKLEGACVPSFLGPRYESIQRCLTQAGPSVPPPPPSQKLGETCVPSFRRSSLTCYKFRDVWHRPGHLCPPPPPSQTMGGARAPLSVPPFNPFRDVSQAGTPVPPSQTLAGARVLSFRRSSLVEMPGNSRFAHFTPLINWLINASREGSRRPGALGGVKGAPGRDTGKRYIGFIWIHRFLFLNVPFNDENDDLNVINTL